MVIAIDGPAGAGKSTVARAVAAALGFTYLDSGAMYRCVALAAIRRGADLGDAAALGELARSLRIELDGERVELDGEDVGAAIREPAVTEAASRVSVHAPVREAMVAEQRRLVAAGRYVAEGRDIGTVVSPEAPLKVFLTASRRGARPPPRRADGRGRGRRPRRPARARRARRDPRPQRPAGRRGRGRDRHHRAD